MQGLLSLVSFVLLTLNIAISPAYGFVPPHQALNALNVKNDRVARRELSALKISILEPQTFDLTRRIFFRGLGFVYGTAFLVAHNQNEALIGDRGLTPARDVLERRSIDATWKNNPSLFQLKFWMNRRDGQIHLDFWLRAVALMGMGLSCIPLLTGNATFPVLFTMWLLYLSIVNVGGLWYAFGWESQLLETGFLAAWSVPFLPRAATPPAWLPVWGYRWLLFRIMLGSGLIKLQPSSSKCWRCWRKNQTPCMQYFYETQPVPSPLARQLHFLPSWFHKGTTYANHIVELVLPWLLLLPPIRGTWLRSLSIWGGGVTQLAFQILLISIGNLSFLNVLTMLPAVWLLDDTFIGSSLLGRFLAFPWSTHSTRALKLGNAKLNILKPTVLYHAPSLFIAFLLAWRSMPVILNLMCKNKRGKQIMNGCFDPFRLVNTYGAFGFVHEIREEIIISGTRGNWDAPPDAWKEYEFAVKPGSINRPLPCIVPYHHRLDWCLWLITLRKGNPDRYAPWLRTLLLKLLQNDRETSKLLANRGQGNPFLHDNGPPPTFLKVERYRYAFSKPNNSNTKAPAGVWERQLVGRFFQADPIFSAKMLEK